MQRMGMLPTDSPPKAEVVLPKADSRPVEAAPTVAPVPTGIRTPWSEFWRKFRRQRVAVVALGFIGLLVVVAVLAPWIVPYDPVNDFDYDRINEGPSLAHWLGVDPLGRGQVQSDRRHAQRCRMQRGHCQ